ASKAFDSDMESYWESVDSAEKTWLAFELRSFRIVSSLGIAWKNAPHAQYHIQISDDGVVWNTVYTVNKAIYSGEQEIRFKPVSARYMRVYCLSGAAGQSFSIYEIRINPVILAPEDEISVEEASASSVANDNSPVYAVDSNAYTRWESEHGVDPQWLILKFNTEERVCAMRISWETAAAEKYHIQVSGDGKKWKTVHKVYGGKKDEEKIISFDPVNAGYMRILCSRRVTIWGYSVYEVKLYREHMYADMFSEPEEKDSSDDIVTVTEQELTGSVKYESSPPIQKLIRTFTKESNKDLEDVSNMLLRSSMNDPVSSANISDEEFIDMIQQRLFLFFWYECNPKNGVTLDRGRCFVPTEHKLGSIASVGFMLTAMGIGHARGWITYEQAYERVITTLRFHRDVIENVNGFYYHFLEIDGSRSGDSELSTIDSAIFIAGVLFSMEYFKGTEIEEIGREIYLRVNWRWAHDKGVPNTHGGKFCAMGWNPWGKWSGSDAWERYCEGLLLTVVEMGHPTADIGKSAWYDIRKSRGDYKGFETVSETGPLFCYQYQHLWFDFRNKNDGWANHFQVSVNKTLANRQFAIDLMHQRQGYGPDSWGFTACDHPDGYHPFAGPPGPTGENGTITPAAPGGSVFCTPYFSIRALRYMYDTWRSRIWGKYGFVDAYNIEKDWFAPDNIGIDQGAILLSIENYRSGLVWKYMMKNSYVESAFKKIGFRAEARTAASVKPLDLSGENWLFNTGNEEVWAEHGFDDSNWSRIYVPDKWENQLLKEYNGTAWYRKHFTVTKQQMDLWKDKRLTVHIGGVDDIDTVFINGAKAGTSSGWKEPRVYHIERRLIRTDEDNVIAVKVEDTTGDGGIWIRPVEIGPYLPMDWKPFNDMR
ncbi:glucoamylase family protein, partial [Elusimicrobiota bacterium]